MRLENLNFDATDPHRLAAFWAAALGADTITDEEDLVEVRMHLPDDRFLDLCFERVPDRSAVKSRLHPDLTGGNPREQQAVVERLIGLGAKNRLHLDVRPGPDDGAVAARLHDLGDSVVTDDPDLPWMVYADPSGNEFCVLAPST